MKKSAHAYARFHTERERELNEGWMSIPEMVECYRNRYKYYIEVATGRIPSHMA